MLQCCYKYCASVEVLVWGLEWLEFERAIEASAQECSAVVRLEWLEIERVIEASAQEYSAVVMMRCVCLGSAAMLLYCYWRYLSGRRRSRIACSAACPGSWCFGGRSGNYTLGPARSLGRLCCGNDSKVTTGSGSVADDDHVGRQGEHKEGQSHDCNVKSDGDNYL
jgi:hypothetical protein